MKHQFPGLPDLVVSKAEAMGEPGVQWLLALPDCVRTLEQRWSMRTHEVLAGGSEALVLSATADGRDAVLKIGLPQEEGLRHEVHVFSLAKGRGYAELFAQDKALNACLLERLGRPLGNWGADEPVQIERLCETLLEAWIPISDDEGFTTGIDKAQWLRNFIQTVWDTVPHELMQAVREQAIRYSNQREAAWKPEKSLLVHGDAHPFNALEDPARPGRCKFVDPDGYFMEPAYDLGLLMRDFHEDLLAGDPLVRGRARCERLASVCGEDAEAVWQWGFIERLTTGLYLMQLGEIEEGRRFLSILPAWLE